MTEHPGGEAKGDGMKAETFVAFLGSEFNLMSDPRFRSIPLSGGYADYAAVLSPDEVIELATAAKGNKTALVELTRQVRKYRFVLAYIYEWETGLDG